MVPETAAGSYCPLLGPICWHWAARDYAGCIAGTRPWSLGTLCQCLSCTPFSLDMPLVRETHMLTLPKVLTTTDHFQPNSPAQWFSRLRLDLNPFLFSLIWIHGLFRNMLVWGVIFSTYVNFIPWLPGSFTCCLIMCCLPVADALRTHFLLNFLSPLPNPLSWPECLMSPVQDKILTLDACQYVEY